MEVEVNTRPLERQFAATPEELRKAFRAAYLKLGKRYLAHHKRLHLSGRPGIQATTGRGWLARRQRQYTVTGKTLGEMTLKMAIRSRLARWYEEGATIVPTHARFLAVPLPAAQTSKGRVKPEFRKLLKGGRRKIGDPTDTPLFPLKVGNRLFLVRHGRGKGDPLEFIFQLLPRVTVRPRLQFFATWRAYRAEARAFVFEALPKAITAARRRAQYASLAKPA